MQPLPKLDFNVKYMILTETGVGSHGPGEGTDLSCILGLPQTLELGKLTGRADECAQALRRESGDYILSGCPINHLRD